MEHDSLKKLEKLSRALEIIFNNTHDAMFLVKVEGDEFRFLRNNRTHQSLTGFAAETMAGKTPQELLGSELGGTIEAN